MNQKILSGRYEIIEEVGMGGMAHVYKARCHLLNRIVAIKMLRNDLEGGEEFIQRFNREAQSAAGLTHPNIVSIYDVGEDNGNHYIVMEYMEGITLKEYIKQKGKLDPEEASYIALEICSALEAAHEKNIVHRDIKPHNIMITTDNRVKVTDFGIARASNNATMHTGESVLGSVHYISPEQARGGYVDCKSDIYSLGIVFYEMLTGHVPFESDSLIAVAMKHLEEKPVPPCELDPAIPVEIQDIVLKAMSKETRNRYQTVSAMKADIEATMSNSAIPETDYEPEEDADITQVIPVIRDIEVKDDFDIKSEKDETEDDGVYQVDVVDEEDEEVDKKSSTVKMVVLAATIAFLFVGTLSVGVTWLLFPDLPIFNVFSNSDISVPKFVGYNYEEAKEMAQEAGLLLEIGDEITSTEPVDTIVKQNTAEGRKVKRGETIIVYVSKGLAEFNAEDYIGMKERDAVDDLEAKGYKVTVKTESSTEIAKDCVIKVKKKDTKITLYVSKGYDDIEVVVPNIVGKKLDIAEQILDETSLVIGKVVYKETDIYEPGTVIKQDISSGEKVTAKTPINVTVAGEIEDDPEEKTDENKDENSEGDKKTTSNNGGSSSSNLERAKTISIALPSDRASVNVKATTRPVGGGAETEFYNATLNTSQKEVNLRVIGKSKLELVIYFDGVQVSTKVVDFTE